MPDLCNEDEVVAAVEDFRNGAFVVGEDAFDEGDAEFAGEPGNGFEAIGAAAGELRGKVALVFGEDVDADEFGGFELWEYGGFAVDANQDEGRIEGNGGEGVDSHAVGRAVGAEGGDDGDAGGEFAAGGAEGMRIDRWNRGRGGIA